MKTFGDHPTTLFGFFSRLVYPFSKNEDSARREYILNVLLLGSIIFSLAGTVLVTIDYVRLGPGNGGVSPFIISGVLLFFVVLYALSRFRYYKVSSIIFVSFYFLIGLFVSYSWGIMLAQGWIVNVLVILMSSVLISTLFAGIVSLLIVAAMFLLTHLQAINIIHPQLDWINEVGRYNDAVGYSFALLVVMIVSWLSNREIDKSLKRARESEALLKEERDLLEVRVRERTRQLLKTQRQEIHQLYRFAEFGRMATDLFHGLINPLTSVSLNLKEFNTKKRAHVIDRAAKGVKNMERFIESARKQIQQQQTVARFRPSDEIILAKDVLSNRLRSNRITLDLEIDKTLEIVGDPIRFHKVIVNLLANAIDGCAAKVSGSRKIAVRLRKVGSKIRLQVEDTGIGMEPKQLKQIFTPFFTTKGTGDGMGIGLAIVKEVVEENLGGTIAIRSKPNVKTEVLIEFPQLRDD